MTESQIDRANIKPETIERLSKYAKVRLGIGVDNLINDAMNTLEQKLASPKKEDSVRNERA